MLLLYIPVCVQTQFGDSLRTGNERTQYAVKAASVGEEGNQPVGEWVDWLIGIVCMLYVYMYMLCILCSIDVLELSVCSMV